MNPLFLFGTVAVTVVAALAAMGDKLSQVALAVVGLVAGCVGVAQIVITLARVH